MTPLEFPYIGAKWAVGLTAMAHVIIAVATIGFAFFVTVAQIIGYIWKDRRYDLLAKQVQLVHVCLYNIGTVLAIGLLFTLQGLYPQFWSQIFVHQFWSLILEEVLFFLLATTVTFHYFFWEHMWGHKKMHIFLGSLMTPLFLLQFYLINGIGAYMMTPGTEKAGSVNIATGIWGWDAKAFYNPSFLMLTFHRAFANVSYGAFLVAAICGAYLYITRSAKARQYYIDGGRLAVMTGFTAFLSLPLIGYFYAHAIMKHCNEAYVNLMWGTGDVVALGINWWWVKQSFVVMLLGLCLGYFYRLEKNNFGLSRILAWSIGLAFTCYYFFMGNIMTWRFFWISVICGWGSALLAGFLLSQDKENPRSFYLLAGTLSVLTVILGGYVREASRPRHDAQRIAYYDDIHVPEHRAPYLMVDVDEKDLPTIPEKILETPEAVSLLRLRCSGCHTLERVKNYEVKEAWPVILQQMKAYGARINDREEQLLLEHLTAGKPY